MSVKTKNLFDQIHNSILSSSADKVAKELGCHGDWKLGSYIRISVSRIAKNTKLHERTVRRCLKLLRSLGFITKVRPHSMRNKTPTEYKLNYEAIQFSIEASLSLFKADDLKEKQRQFRKMERRLQRQKEVQNFFFDESVDNLEKHDEISEKTPGRMPGNNIAIDYCINTVGFNNSVDNFGNMEVANDHNMEKFYLPCDTIGKNSELNLDIYSALETILIGKGGSAEFLHATRLLDTLQDSIMKT